MSEKHFLVFRDRRGIRTIDVYDDCEQQAALTDYAAMEDRCESANRVKPNPLGPFDCCLFGADSLATLCRTHASWFAPETIAADLDALLHPASVQEKSGSKGERSA